MNKEPWLIQRCSCNFTKQRAAEMTNAECSRNSRSSRIENDKGLSPSRHPLADSAPTGAEQPQTLGWAAWRISSCSSPRPSPTPWPRRQPRHPDYPKAWDPTASDKRPEHTPASEGPTPKSVYSCENGEDWNDEYKHKRSDKMYWLSYRIKAK